MVEEKGYCPVFFRLFMTVSLTEFFWVILGGGVGDGSQERRVKVRLLVSCVSYNDVLG